MTEDNILHQLKDARIHQLERKLLVQAVKHLVWEVSLVSFISGAIIGYVIAENSK
jgi:hypothetical protein